MAIAKLEESPKAGRNSVFAIPADTAMVETIVDVGGKSFYRCSTGSPGRS